MLVVARSSSFTSIPCPGRPIVVSSTWQVMRSFSSWELPLRIWSWLFCRSWSGRLVGRGWLCSSCTSTGWIRDEDKVSPKISNDQSRTKRRLSFSRSDGLEVFLVAGSLLGGNEVMRIELMLRCCGVLYGFNRQGGGGGEWESQPG